VNTTNNVESPVTSVPAGSQPGGENHGTGTNDRTVLAVGPSASPAFPRGPGETPRAFSAFMTWFQLGHHRSLAAVADKLGESLGTVKNWSSKYDWAGRFQTCHSGCLQEQARNQSALHLQQVADWNRRLDDFREQEWEAAQKLIAVAQCFLETCGEDDVRRMTLAQVSRALKISSGMARSAIMGAERPASSETGLAPLQQQLLAGLTRIYGPSTPAAPSPTPTPQPLTLNS